MFRNWVFDNFPFLENDFDALTDYELFCKMVEYMKKSLKEVESFQDELNSFNNKLIELENEINNFNVQEEVDNKLDEMLESGQLAEIISEFLEYAGVLAYNTKSELKNGTNFVNGSIAVTIGKDTYNDGKTSYYKIRNILTTDVIDEENILSLTNFNDLIAEKIINYDISFLFNEVDDNKEKIQFNKVYNLSDNVQARLYKDVSSLFDVASGWSVSAILIKEINNVNKGIAVANDWTTSGNNGNKFDIVTFDFIDETITNKVTRAELLNGHSNSICEIGNNKVLICANGYNYIYDLANNTYNEVTDDLPFFSVVVNDENGIYAIQDYDYSINETINRLYILDVDNENDTIEIDSYKTIPNLRDKIQGNEQGAVLYNGLLIFTSFANCKLCIYDFETLDYLKTQLFTSPYIVEFEDGFIFNDKLLLVDSQGRLFEPDIYGKNVIGGYSYNNITKSLTDICLLDTPVKLQNGENITLSFEKYMTFMNENVDTNIGTMGSQLESITIYMAVRNFSGSGGVHNMIPVEIPLYKNITYEGDTISWYSYHWQSYWEEYNNGFNKTSLCGDYTIGGGNTVPTLNLSVDSYKLTETWSGSSYTFSVASETFDLYIVKIIGHRKVGFNY